MKERQNLKLNIFEFINNLGTAIYKKGKAVIEEGSKDVDKMYFLLEGELLISHTVGQKTIELGTLQEGDFFGEYGIITKKTRDATITVISKDARIGILDKEKFLHISQANPVFLFELLKYMVERLDNAEKTIVNLSREISDLLYSASKTK